MDDTGTTGEAPHAIPGPPPGPASPEIVPAEPFVANPFDYEPPPLRPGQLAAPWKTLFIAGWFGVLVGFGCIWQAGRVAGVAPWWLGPETNPRPIFVTALPFIGPVLAIIFAAANSRWAVYVGLGAAVASIAISFGDLDDTPGLADGQAVIGLAGLFVTIAAFSGRMRKPADNPSVAAVVTETPTVSA